MLRHFLAALALLVPFVSEAQTNNSDPLTPVPCPNLNWVYADPAFQPLAGARAFHGRYEGGLYRIEIPDNWNGELVMWAHGAREATGPEGHVVQPEVPGSARPASPGGPIPRGSVALRRHWIQNGFAWAASTFRCNGGVPGYALLDTLRLRDTFTKITGRPEPVRSYLMGMSMGGQATLLAAHVAPTTFAGHLALCPVVTPGRWDFAVAAAAAAEAISGVSLGPSSMDTDMARMREVFGTPANYTQKGRQLASIQIALSGGPRPFAVEGLAVRFEANVRAGVAETTAINAATNENVAYTLDERLGLSAADLNKQVRRKRPDEALRGLASAHAEVGELSGRIQRPIITLHGTGDLQVPISGQRVLRQVVEKAGTASLLVQRIIRIPGHCQFSDEEQIQAFDDLAKWVREGTRPEGDDVMADFRDAGRKFTNPLRIGDPGIVEIGGLR